MTAGAVGRTAIAGAVLAALSGSSMTAVSLSSPSAPVALPTFAAAPAPADAAADGPAQPESAPEPAGAGVVDGGTLAAIALTPAIAAAQPVEAPAPAFIPPPARRHSPAVVPRPGEGRRERMRRAIAEHLSADTRTTIRRACATGVLDGRFCRLG